MSDTVYKVTDANGKTQAGTKRELQWGQGVQYRAPGAAPWATENWLYCAMDPVIASLHAPVIVGYENHAAGVWKLWECEADLGIWWPPYLLPGHFDDHLAPFPWTFELFEKNRYMRGATRLKTLAEIPQPTITTQKRIDLLYAIGAAVGPIDDEINRSGFCAMSTMMDTGGLTATDAWLDKVIHRDLLPWSVYAAYYTHQTGFDLPAVVHTVMD